MATKPPPAAPPKTPPKNTKPAQPKTSAVSIGQMQPKPIAPRIVLNATEGFGKTSCGAYADNPVIIMANEETGYETLLSAGRVPQIDGATVHTWSEFLQVLDQLGNDCPYNTVVLDALGWFERMCHEHVGTRDFDGNMGDKGFLSFHKGYDISVGDWIHALVRLDKIQKEHGATILILSHAKVQNFKNPMGEDFDRYIADCHAKTWGVTHKWADAVLFGNFHTITEESKSRKIKGIGGDERLVYTQRRDAYDAKNRFGMDEVIHIPDDPSQMWSTIWGQISSTEG